MLRRLRSCAPAGPHQPLAEFTRTLAPALLLSTLALAALGCAEDGQAPTGPTAAPGPDQAVTAAAYTVKDLGTLGGPYSSARAINNVGSIVGTSSLASGAQHAFLYRAGVMRDLGALAGGQSQALAINDAGVVVGSSTVRSGAWRAVRWKDGVKTNLGTLGGQNSEATGINQAGVIVGWSETASGQHHAFVWRNGVMTDLGTLGGTWSHAYGINRWGRIVGYSTTASGERHAVAWSNTGVVKDLGTRDRVSSVATAINDNGQIAGILGTWPDAAGEELAFSNPFLFYQGTWTVFGTGQLSSDAWAISATGTIVGGDFTEREEDATNDAWVWESGTVTRLPELAPGNSGAHGVNQYGTIVGYGPSTADPTHAMLWRRQ
jgi:probable HAF family extracellular repeat protein